MWYRYGTLQEVVHRVVLNMLIYTELLCAPCRHGEHGGVGKVLGIRMVRDTVAGHENARVGWKWEFQKSFVYL